MRPSSGRPRGLSVWNGRRPGASTFTVSDRARSWSRGFLPSHAGRSQYQRSRTPGDRLEIADDEAGSSRSAHPDGVAFARSGDGQRAAFLCRILADVDVEESRRHQGSRVRLPSILSGSVTLAVAHDEGALGRFDQAMNMREAVAFGRRAGGHTARG